MQRIDYIGEGETDAVVARRLIEHIRAEPGRNWLDRRGPRGKDALDRRLEGFAIAARHDCRILVLRDLDQDAVCAGLLVARLLPDRPAALLLRIAVRSVEAWFMADRPGLAFAMRVSEHRIPLAPEALADPKATMAAIGRRSRNAGIRAVFQDTAQVQAGWLIEFASERWSVERASASGAAPSLNRALARLASPRR